jgi:hypothetical protein
MIILGIDPGTTLIGWGLVSKQGSTIIPLKYGCIKGDKIKGRSERLSYIFASLSDIIEKNKPDIYLGHNSDNVWAAKSGIPVLPAYGGPNTYVGYLGAFDLARCINRVLKNPTFNKKLSKNVRQPYFKDWYTDQPYKYIVQGDENL